MSCFGCSPYNDEPESVKRCSRCKQVTYCSVRCQTSHWPRHKPNCLPSDSPVHQLFRVCFEDIFPETTNPIWWQFGFASISEHHGNVISNESYTALQILLGLYQAIRIDVCFAEDPDPTQPPRNTIGMSKKLLQKAYKTNTLDDLLHRYINNCISNYGDNIAKYCFMWCQCKLIIGPTRPTSDNMEEWQKIKKETRRNIYAKYYGE